MVKIILPLILLIVAAALAFFLYSKNGSLTPLNTVVTHATPNTTQNITSQNVDQALSQTDQSLGTAMDQMDKDLQQIDQADQSADNTNNL